MFFDFYPTLLKCAKLINGFRCFPLLYKSWFNWLLIHCLSFHWFLSQRKPCEGDEFCPYPFYPVPLPPEGQQSDQTHQPNTNSNANPNSNGNIGKKNLIRPKPGKKITFVADDEQNACLLIKKSVWQEVSVKLQWAPIQQPHMIYPKLFCENEKCLQKRKLTC